MCTQHLQFFYTSKLGLFYIQRAPVIKPPKGMPVEKGSKLIRQRGVSDPKQQGALSQEGMSRETFRQGPAKHFMRAHAPRDL